MQSPLLKTTWSRNIIIKTIFILLLPLLSYGQNQYWNTEISGFSISPLPYGILEMGQNNVHALTNASFQTHDFFGNAIDVEFSPGIGSLELPFFYEKRSDLILIGSISQLSEAMEINVFDAITYENLFTIDLDAYSNFDLGAIPLGFKGIDANEYYMIGQYFIHKIQINGTSGYEEIYSVLHNKDGFSSAIVKNNSIYLLSSTGSIYTLESNGDLNEISNLSAKLNTVVSTADGFLIGGEKDGENVVIKINDSFEEQWSSTYGEKDCRKIFTSSNQGYLITGESSDGTGYLMKINESGDEVWKSSQLLVPGVAINENPVGNIFVLGRSTSDLGINQLTKVGPNGEEGSTVDPDKFSNERVSANNISAHISNQGNLFFDGGNSAYNFPAGASTSTFFGGNLWIGGIDPEGNLKVAANTYGLWNGGGDFDMGPMDAEDPKFFERVWFIKQKHIEEIRNDLIDGEKNIDWYPNIEEWPAKGNTITATDGTSLLIENDLAPYVDVNGDGEYHVEDGDYPKIKGDEMAWWIMNDDRNHTASGGDILEIEVIGTFYGIGCDEDHISYNTTYLDYEIKSKSQESLLGIKAGLWLDADLGCHTDDYIGSIPDRNAIMIYNADAIDGTTGAACDGGTSTFADEPPLQTVVTLNRPLDNFIYFVNSSIGIPPIGMIEPNLPVQYYNYLSGKWRDGTPFTIGGTGYNPGNTNTTTIAFPGNPSNPVEWSQCSVDAWEQDRRIVMSTNIESLNPGESFTIQYALITSTNIDYPCPALDNVKTDIETIQNMHNSNGNLHFDLGPDRNLQDQNPITLDPGEGGLSYEWSTGATSQSITVSESGTYTVSITNAVGCEVVESINIEITNSLQNIEKQLLNIYPNPTNDNFTIELPEIDSNFDISVLSIDGKVMLRKGDIGSGRSTYNIPASNWGSGVYFVKVRSELGNYVDKVSILR